MTTRAFDNEACARRARILRIALAPNKNQAQFEAMLDIKSKRWSNYERSGLVPRDMGWRLVKMFPGFSVEWLWFGATGNLSKVVAKKLAEAELKLITDAKLRAAIKEAEAEAAAAQRRLAALKRQRLRY